MTQAHTSGEDRGTGESLRHGYYPLRVKLDGFQPLEEVFEGVLSLEHLS